MIGAVRQAGKEGTLGTGFDQSGRGVARCRMAAANAMDNDRLERSGEPNVLCDARTHVALWLLSGACNHPYAAGAP
jgi:hypothetical protein